MIRFIDIGDQIINGGTDFAWFDTVIGRFLEFNGMHVWSSWDEFINDFNGSVTQGLRFFDLLYAGHLDHE